MNIIADTITMITETIKFIIQPEIFAHVATPIIAYFSIKFAIKV